MKSHGSKCEYHTERARDLLRAYYKYIAQSPHINLADAYNKIVDMPAARFWVSAPRATIVIAALLRGEKLKHMRYNKREMFLEIFRRVLLLRQQHPRWSIPRLVETVIEQPAPKFYLAPGSAKVYILNAKKKLAVRNFKLLISNS